MPIAAILQIVNLALPLATKIIVGFKKNADGTTDINLTITQTDEQFNANLKQTTDWFAAHPPV